MSLLSPLPGREKIHFDADKTHRMERSWNPRTHEPHRSVMQSNLTVGKMGIGSHIDRTVI
jgi:hypothetical protein